MGISLQGFKGTLRNTGEISTFNFILARDDKGYTNG